ncbi:ATP-dependent DNA helicase [Aaosphaeria arxii CBS 175.79]|uniref:ATP-dependent DNA helicase n=1 Tax=Aaosphaeria arxii CBS 175.79 TaxID=1450172 RepID=A0A6A5Y2P7_9PLEO|nr:ATP-dependent DNA helicase [Aaosphaeria arxii CBS 175.79]KAF2019171.1 ATP-dependent DNA helicase [Aaosphaeria arxii CBS 175.79]
MSDDEFGLGSDDDFEAALVHASDTAIAGKRKQSIDIATTSSKKTKIDSPSLELARKVLKERFGLPNFRLKQEEAVARILDGGSAVVVFPTGGGKSLCYQVPAVAFKEQDRESSSRAETHSGVTLVISPLIALMKDQVDALLRRKIRAAVLNSSVDRAQFLATQDDLRNGRLDLIYCAPERLNAEGFIQSLQAIPGGIRLLAVDEAHCISEWGHSFRPEYLKIARFAQEAKVERVICLTATATPRVVEDICAAFSIPQEGVFKTTVYRPNLRLLAESRTKDADEVTVLCNFLRKNPGPTIVYVTLQKGAEELALSLKRNGFDAKPYHAGMDTKVKEKTQELFLPSKKMIIVATIAFGMGIDKPDIRNIVHFDVPRTIEDYCQQIGRAGRDGLPSVCFFKLSTKDFYLRNVFTYGDRPSLNNLRKLLGEISSPERRKLQAGDSFKVSFYAQEKDFDIRSTTLGIIYAQLELHFKLFRRVGSEYSEYKYFAKDPGALTRDSTPESKAIQASAKGTQKWKTVDLEQIVARRGFSRPDLVRKLDTWNEKGMVEVKKAGTTNVFRLEKPLPSNQKEIDEIAQHLDRAMENKELQDLKRTQALIDLITSKECFAHSITSYFGESNTATSTGTLEECGHCTWCETHKQITLPDEPAPVPTSFQLKQVMDACPMRDDPRFLAKIAFGIKTPWMRTLGLQKSPAFESMMDCDFMELVRAFEAECKKANK